MTLVIEKFYYFILTRWW